MAAEFHKVFNMEGFDKDQTPPWQMVPVGGDRYLALRNGKDMTVRASPTGVLAVTEITRSQLPTHGRHLMPLHTGDRLFKLTGISKGHALLGAGPTIGPPSAALQIDTKHRKTVRVTFNFVRDSAGHHTTRSPSSAAAWVRAMNWIYNGQANIFVTLRTSRSLAVPIDLGTVVTWSAGAGSEWNTVTALGDTAADMNYFLVWEYEQGGTGDTDAGTLTGNCIFEDHAGRAIGVTMAHEMGHHLGAADHYDGARRIHLMHGITDARGEHLPMADVNVMNP